MRAKNLSTSQSAGGRRGVAAFTLAEVVTAVAIVAVVFGGILLGYMQSIKRAEWSGYSLAAQGLAIQQMEQARAAVWDQSLQKNELTNLNLTAWTYNTNTLSGSGYTWGALDVPYNNGTNSLLYATNFVSLKTIAPVGQPAGVRVQMLRVDTVWVYRGFGGQRIYTNRMATYFAPDNRDASTL